MSDGLLVHADRRNILELEIGCKQSFQYTSCKIWLTCYIRQRYFIYAIKLNKESCKEFYAATFSQFGYFTSIFLNCKGRGGGGTGREGTGSGGRGGGRRGERGREAGREGREEGRGKLGERGEGSGERGGEAGIGYPLSTPTPFPNLKGGSKGTLQRQSAVIGYEMISLP